MWFNQHYIDFFKNLSKNNNKEWFHAHKMQYEMYVKKPFYAFVAELIDRLDVDLEVKNAVFRINRDIRFSKDKTPYKNHMSAIISNGGRKNREIPGLYFHAEIGNVMIGGGAYMLQKENLYKIRKAIVDQPQKVNQILTSAKFLQHYNGLVDGEKNKVLPKEFKEPAKDIPLIYNKQYYYMSRFEDEDFLLREDLLEYVLSTAEAGREWNSFLTQAIQ